LLSPDWFALIVQVPAATKVIVVVATVHTPVVADVKATVNELLEVAEIDTVPLPKVLFVSEPKVIV
jgi:hypothetical protein